MHRPVVHLVAAVAMSAVCCPAIAQTAEELPARRPGQWEISMVTEKPSGAPPITMQTCIDPATDRELMEFGLRMARGSCKKYTMQREGKGFVIDAECRLGPIRSTTHTTLSGDFQSKYTVRIEGTSESKIVIGDKGKGPQPMLMVQTARWAGAACTQGMKPGDIAMPGGVRFNVQKMKGLQQMLPQILGK